MANVQNNTYIRHFMTATAKAAKVTGTPVEEIRANYRNFKDATCKKALIVAYRIMRSYEAKAVEPAVEE